MAGPLSKRELPAEGCSRRNDKREEGSRQKKYLKMDSIMINADTKRKAEKMVEWRMLSLK